MQTKVCSRCTIELPLLKFSKSKTHKNGIMSWCKSCVNKNWKIYYQRNKDKIKDKMKKEYHKDPEKHQTRARNWRQENKELVKKIRRKTNLKCAYNLTVEDYAILLQNQCGVCCICKQPETTIVENALMPLSVDHDHKTGKVRGLLCFKCNRGLGQFNDSPVLLRTAADYLEREE